jgi:hypothetical protein
MSATLPPTSTLQAIQTKVRRLTRSPSETQLTTPDLQNYINTFVVYDFPEHIRTFKDRQQFTFVCNPFQDRYPTDILSFGGVTTNQLYNFQNKYLTVHDPLYIAGFPSLYTQSRDQFFGIYPKVNNIQSIGFAGDGVTLSFTGTLPIANQPNSNINAQNQGSVLLQNQVLFDSIAVDGAGLALQDVPVLDTTTGNPSVNGNLYVPGFQPTTPPTVITPANTINYVTGVYTITFPSAPASGAPINSQTVPQVLARPQAMLYHNNTFYLRPVPDQPYTINFEVYASPTFIMETSNSPGKDSPALNEYWQYIAYGAAKKIFEDRMDLESVQLIMPEFKKQQELVLRRTIVQLTNERVSTIYTDQLGGGPAGGWGWFGANF